MKILSIKKHFADFDFSNSIFQAIKQAGYESPTDVQSEAIPAIMQGRDVLAGAETGSGKTAAFALPLLEKILRLKAQEEVNAAKGNHIRALILVPTRELAIQISEVFNEFAQSLPHHIKAIGVFGGVKINPQMMSLRGGAEILVATPGRLLDLAEHNTVKFNKLHTLILDEVDRLVGEGFKDEIEEVFKLLPNQRQNLMFTATYPESIRYLVRQLLKQPAIINIQPDSEEVNIDQRVFTVNRENKTALLAHLINTYDWKQILVFCSAKRTCDRVVLKLAKHGIEAIAMHGNKEQRARAKALREFKQGKFRVLVATDVAGRGLDIEQLPCIINYELPRSPNDYIHRIGRTGRAGESGFALSLIAHHEYAHFSVIEKRCDIKLEREQVEGLEASEEAPPPPVRNKPKKKARKKLSKKKRQRLQEKKDKAKSEGQIAPQKVEDTDGYQKAYPDRVEPYSKTTKPKKYEGQSRSASSQRPQSRPYKSNDERTQSDTKRPKPKRDFTKPKPLKRSQIKSDKSSSNRVKPTTKSAKPKKSDNQAKPVQNTKVTPAKSETPKPKKSKPAKFNPWEKKGD